MSTLSTRREYADGDILTEADLDAFLDDIETFLNTTKINDDNIQAGGITASTKLVDASITAGKLGTESVTTTKIEDLAVTTAKLAATAVTTAKITDLNVTTAKINDAAVTTAKINDAAVTQAKRASLGQQLSSSCGTFSTLNSTLTDITNLTVTITTTGRPVFVGCVASGGGGTSEFNSIDTTNSTATIAIVRDVTVISRQRFGAETATQAYALPSSVWTIDAPSAGTYTYKVQIGRASGGTSAGAIDVKLVAYEL